MNLIGLFDLHLSWSKTDRGSTHSSLQNAQDGRVTISRGGEIGGVFVAGFETGWMGARGPNRCHANPFCGLTAIYSEEQEHSKVPE